MIVDSNARRRNLFLSSILIIVFFVGGATPKEGGSITLGFVNLELSRTWAVYTASWLMFAWFWWQFRIERFSYADEFKKDVAPNHSPSTNDPGSRFSIDTHPFGKRLKGLALKNLNQSHGASSNIKFELAHIKKVRISGEQLRLFDKKGWNLQVWYQHANVQNGNQHAESFAITSPFERMVLHAYHIRHRPGFSDIVAPQIFAVAALCLGVWFAIPHVLDWLSLR